MNKFNHKLAVAGASVLPAFCSFAEGETTPTMGDAASTVGTQIQTGFTSLASTLATPIGAIIVAGLGLWLIFTVVKLFKRAWNRSA